MQACTGFRVLLDVDKLNVYRADTEKNGTCFRETEENLILDAYPCPFGVQGLAEMPVV